MSSLAIDDLKKREGEKEGGGRERERGGGGKKRGRRKEEGGGGERRREKKRDRGRHRKMITRGAVRMWQMLKKVYSQYFRIICVISNTIKVH